VHLRPDRRILLATDQPRDETALARIAALQSKIKELAREQDNIITELRANQPLGDVDGYRQWREHLRRAFTQIAAQQAAVDQQLTAITKQPEPCQQQDPRFLDQFPIIEGDLANLPENLERDLWARFQPQVR
jgi:hypothetical protein